MAYEGPSTTKFNSTSPSNLKSSLKLKSEMNFGQRINSIDSPASGSHKKARFVDFENMSFEQHKKHHEKYMELMRESKLGSQKKDTSNLKSPEKTQTDD